MFNIRKKISEHAVLLSTVVLLAILTVSCAVDPLPTIFVKGVSLDRTDISLTEGESVSLVASVSPSNATDPGVTWSSDSNVATVDQTGKVTALMTGRATITVRTNSGGYSAYCNVTVSAKTYQVTGVSLDKSNLTMTEGDTGTLTASVTPANATNKNVTWSSSDASVASVSQDGTVTAVKAGSATITVTTEDGDKTASCEVTVKEPAKATSIYLDSQSFNAFIGKYYDLRVSAYPEDAKCEYEWETSDSSIATVSAYGPNVEVYTKNYGIVDITVREIRSNLTSTLSITTCLNSFEWNEYTSETYSSFPMITIETGSTYQLHYSCSPSYATNLFSDLSQFVFYEPTYVVDYPSCISIDKNGLVKGLKAGITGIKATGRLLASSSRVYFKVVDPYYSVTGIKLNKTSLEMMEGSYETLTATLTPSNASNSNIIWSSDNTNVATVSNGTVNAKKKGEATITVKSEDGGYTASCKVKVISTEDLKGYHSNHEYIDLGLSVKWATYNLGGSASSPIGKYYLWGDASNSGTIYFYTPPSMTNISGTSYDSAKYSWGGSWRMPTMQEFRELVNNCSFEPTTSGGVSGLKVTGPSGGSMFLPATGMGMPKDGPIGSVQYTDTSSGYYLSGEANCDTYGTFFKYYQFSPNGSASSSSTYNAMAVKMVIRPVVKL